MTAAAPQPAIVILDDLRIDRARRIVERDGLALEVVGLSFELLDYFISQGERVIGFDELIERVWAPAVVSDETVTQRIKLLRQALGDQGRNSRYLRSVRGRGYQLCSAPRDFVAPSPPRVRARASTPGRLIIIAAAFAIALALIWMVSVNRRIAPTAAATESPLQRARYYAAIGQDDNNERAIALFEQTLVSVPSDTEASLGLSRALSARVCLYNRAPDSAVRAQALAETVLARSPLDGAAHAALAYSFDCRGDITMASAEYARAVALDPTGRADSRASLANLQVAQGLLAEALRNNVEVAKSGVRLRFLDLQFARNLDLLGFPAEAERRYATLFRLYPDNVFGNVAYPRFLFSQGRYAEAAARVDEAMQRPQHPDLFLLDGELALQRGDNVHAVDAFRRAAALRPHQDFPQALLRLYGPLDDGWIARRVDDARAAPPRAADDWIELALLQAHQHDIHAALADMRNAVAAGFRDRSYLQTSPLFRSLAAEPGFADVIDSIGQAVARERATVLAADWLPADLLTAKAATPAG